MNRDVAAMSNSGAHARARPVEANSRSKRWVVYSSLTLCAVAWTLVSGKDLNWDALNYHLFSGFSGMNDRIGEEFFPAGAASYFNPYAQVPFYLMVGAGIPALAIGAVLAAVHSLNLWLTYELAMALRPPGADKWVHATAALAVALAVLNPVLLQVTGSSFADATASVPALAGWLALTLAYRSPSLGWILAGGALLGCGTALKLSNGLFALAAIPLVLLRQAPMSRRLFDAAAFGATCALAFLVVAGPWAWRLWSEFGNPLFPLFNAWFASPDFITEALRHDRFLPPSLGDALLRPVQMAVPERMIHTEPRAPDLRYAALFAALVVSAIVRIVHRPQRSETVVHAARGFVFFCFFCFFWSGGVVVWCFFFLVGGFFFFCCFGGGGFC
jgi:hypothetical protein